MSFEQSDTPRDTPTPEKPESSVEIQPLVESHQDSLLIVGESSLGFLQSRWLLLVLSQSHFQSQAMSVALRHCLVWLRFL